MGKDKNCMEGVESMKRISIFALTLAAAVSVAACGESPRETGTVVGDRPGASATTPGASAADMERTREFVQNATQHNMAEIELSKLAQERATNPQVRQFAQQMVEEHTKTLSELRQVAQRDNIQVTEALPEDHRELRDKLQGLKGAEFDREYMDAMVDGHEEMHSLLEDRADRLGDRTATGGNDAVGTTGHQQTEAALNQWASKTLPSVAGHRGKARELRDQLGQQGTGKPGAAGQPRGTTRPRTGTGQ